MSKKPINHGNGSNSSNGTSDNSCNSYNNSSRDIRDWSPSTFLIFLGSVVFFIFSMDENRTKFRVDVETFKPITDPFITAFAVIVYIGLIIWYLWRSTKKSNNSTNSKKNKSLR